MIIRKVFQLIVLDNRLVLDLFNGNLMICVRLEQAILCKVLRIIVLRNLQSIIVHISTLLHKFVRVVLHDSSLRFDVRFFLLSLV